MKNHAAGSSELQSLGNFKQREVISTEHAVEWDFVQV